MNTTNQIKRQQKREFISWMVKNNKNKSFSYKTLSLTLGRFDDIKEEMIQNGDLIIKSKNKYLTFQFGEELVKISTKTIYQSNLDYSDINTNPYFIKLNKLNSEGKLNPKETLIIKSINKTIENSTLDGKPLKLTYLKTKGKRIYSDYIQESKEVRKRIKINGNKTISFDISASQLQLLSKTNIFGYDNKLFFQLKDSNDIWETIANTIGMDRETTKDMVIKSINGRYINPILFKHYPTFFNNLFKLKKENGHNITSILYFNLENNIIGDIMKNLAINNIDFLPVHDCIIVEEKHYSMVKEMFQNNNIKYKIEY